MLIYLQTWLPLAILLVFVLCLADTIHSDEILTIDSRGNEARRTGIIKDVKGGQLTLEVTPGRDVTIPLDRVKKLICEWPPHHREADAKYAAGDFESALSLYRTAFNEEQRRWVKRMLLASVVWCQRNTNRHGEACEIFARLAKDDEQTPYFDAIPVLWQMKQCPSDVERVVRDWSGNDNGPARRLMAASWLMAKQRSRSVSTLRELGKHPSKQISCLAMAQLWRAELLTLKELRITWWISQIDEMPRELRAGAYYLLGQSYARFDRADEAALAFLRVPTTYAEDVMLSQTSLWEAAKVLQKNGQTQEVIQLYRQTVELGRGTEAGQQAAANLAALTK